MTHGDMISNNNYVYTELLTQESLGIVSWIPGTSGISSLRGIEDFKNLKQLSIVGSPISNLNLKNGLNSFLNLHIADCPNLSCVQVDDSIWSTNNWTNIDDQIYFSEDCQ